MRTERHLNGSTKSQNTAHPSKAPFSEGSGTRGPLEIHRQETPCTITGFYHVREAGKDRPAVAYVPLREDAARYAAAPALHEALLAAKRADEALDGREGYAEWEALDNRARELRAAALSLSGAPHV